MYFAHICTYTTQTMYLRGGDDSHGSLAHSWTAGGGWHEMH